MEVAVTGRLDRNRQARGRVPPVAAVIVALGLLPANSPLRDCGVCQTLVMSSRDDDYDAAVVGSKLAATQLKTVIAGDIDQATGGIFWWYTYPFEAAQLAELSHYVESIAGAVATNVDEAAAHFHQYRDRVGAENSFLTLAVLAANGLIPDLRRRTAKERLRNVLITAEQAAFFRSVGSVLDTLAGVTIAVGALGFDLLKADMGTLRTASDSLDYPRIPGQVGARLRKALAEPGTPGAEEQSALLRAVRAAFTHAGPAGWAQWTLDTRNNFVHRSRWMESIVMDRPDKRAAPAWIRPMPRSPKSGEGTVFANAQIFTDSYLSEDAADTMAGILGSLDALTTAVVEQCTGLWTRRRANPALLVQPSSQWSDQTSTPPFLGYLPKSAKRAYSAADALIVNPADGSRLSALAQSRLNRT